VQTIETLIPEDLNLLVSGVVQGETGARSEAESSRLLVELIALSELARSTTPAEHGALEGTVAPVILRKLLTALHFRDTATVQHSRRVSQLAVGIAGYLRWEGTNLQQLEIAALLHDVGKIGVPDNVLFKPGKLNPDESALMGLHHCVSVDVLQDSAGPGKQGNPITITPPCTVMSPMRAAHNFPTRTVVEALTIMWGGGRRRPACL
jgi:HD-GYP domain-containing protein (c-di-GMP phosphodiesterase class II)